MTVRKLLQGKGNFVPFVRSDSSVGDAIELMEADEAGALVVTDDQRRIKGIVSERDVVRALSSHGANVMQASVSEIMTHDVITCALFDLGEQRLSFFGLAHAEPSQGEVHLLL